MAMAGAEVIKVEPLTGAIEPGGVPSRGCHRLEINPRLIYAEIDALEAEGVIARRERGREREP